MKKNVRDDIRLADMNLADSIRLQIKCTSKGEIYETEEYMIYTIGKNSVDAHLNGALCFNDDASEEMLKRAYEFFKERDLDFTIWVRDHADYKLEHLLKKRGLEARRYPGSAVMVIDEKIPTNTLKDEFSIRRVEDRRGIMDFSVVTKEAFEKSREEIDAMYDSDCSLVGEDVCAFVAYEDDTPVSAVMVVLSKEVSGLYWVGTVESARRKGLGSFVTQIATNEGFDLGKKLSILQASETGEIVYEKLGYKTVTRYRTYPIKIRSNEEIS